MTEEPTDLVPTEATAVEATSPSDKAEENKAVLMASTIGNETLSVASDSAKKTLSGVLGAYFEHIAFRYTGYGDVLASNAYERKLSERKAANLLAQLDTIEPKDVTPSPIELSVPLMEQLSHTENDDLAEILIQLLAASGSKSKQHLVHPSMVNAAKNLSPDEALILKTLSQKCDFHGMAMISYSSRDPRPEMKNMGITIREYFSPLDETPGLMFAENVEMYVENLVSLGFFHREKGFYPIKNDKGENIPAPIYDDLIEKAKKNFIPHNKNAVFKSDTFMFKSTKKGRMFLNIFHEIPEENADARPPN